VCRIRWIVSDDQAGVHGNALTINQFAQDLALYKLESGNESTKGFPQGTMALNATRHFERLLISNQPEHGFGMESGHEAFQIAFIARRVSPPNQVEHGFTIFHLCLPHQSCQTDYLPLDDKRQSLG
jgi:hypothetical protein